MFPLGCNGKEVKEEKEKEKEDNEVRYRLKEGMITFLILINFARGTIVPILGSIFCEVGSARNNT
jgi:hypothetical protein